MMCARVCMNGSAYVRSDRQWEWVKSLAWKFRALVFVFSFLFIQQSSHGSTPFHLAILIATFMYALIYNGHYNLWVLFYGLIISDSVNGAVRHGRLQYTRTTLLQLNCGRTCVTDITPQLPDCILKDPGGKTAATKRKWGKRGGVRQRSQKQQLSRIPLPSMILGNVQSPIQNGWVPGKRQLS